MRRQYEYGLRAKAGESLSLEEMKARVPSIFAEQPFRASDRYVPISSTNIMSSLIREGFQPVEARQGRTRDPDRRNFTSHMVRFRKDSDLARKMVGDVFFEVIMRNAYDGTAAYDFSAGLYRLICSNGMAVDEGLIASVHVRHVGNEERITKEVIDGAYEVVRQAPIALAAPRLWSGIELSRDDRMELAEQARVARFGDGHGRVDTPITADQLLIARRPADQGNDLWRTFNVLQENTVRGGLSARGRTRRFTTREVHGIDQDMNLNRTLWRQAAEMAKVKEAA
jgi:hypothetical protein